MWCSLSTTLASYHSKCTKLIQVIDNCNLCNGNSDEQFIELARKRKGKFLTVGGKVIANFEESVCFSASGEERCSTVRHIGCMILLSTFTVCSVCANYCNALRVLSYRHQKSQPHSPHPNMNARFFTTPQRRTHFLSLQKAVHNKN